MSEHIEKIKKLLRLSKDKAATPAEAALALKRALDLINRHNLDIDSLNLDEESEKLVYEYISVGRRISFIKRRVNGILLNYFHVRTIWSYGQLAVVGFEHDVTIAGYVFHFLVRACTSALSQFVANERLARRKITDKKKKSFVQGWMYGVASNLRKDDQGGNLEDQKAAIIIANREKQVASYFDQVFPKTRSVKIAHEKPIKSALYRGYLEGQITSITTPLKGREQEPLRLTA